MSKCDVPTAIVAGYEVGTRAGNAAPMALFLRGFDPQRTSGTFVATATAGRMLRLSAEHVQHAFGIAGSLGAGLTAAQEGAMVKHLHAGHAAQVGVEAALLASTASPASPTCWRPDIAASSVQSPATPMPLG